MVKRRRTTYGYKKTYSRNSKNNTISRGYKKRAYTMTSRVAFIINSRTVHTFTIASGNQASGGDFDVAGTIVNSDMHKQLSSVFDQYRIEKVNIKYKLLSNPATVVSGQIPHINFFTCVDRSGFNANVTLAQLRTYQSYKETSYSTTGDLGRSHYVSVGQSDLVSKSTYYDTKTKAQFPHVAHGIDVGNNVASNLDFKFSIEIDAQVRYRGVRLDTSAVST